MAGVTIDPVPIFVKKPLMKKKLSLLFLLLVIVAKAQIINFSDANFKAKLLSSSPANTVAKNLSGNYFAIDANGDGEIQQTEADAVAELEVVESDSAICANTNFQGISSFTQVKKIKINYGYPINTSQDISNLQNLTHLEINSITAAVLVPTVFYISNCSNLLVYSGLAFPIFTNTPALEDVSLYTRVLTSAEIPLYNSTLASVQSLVNLKKLSHASTNIYDPALTLNLSYHNKLEEVHLISPSFLFGKVDLSHCINLKSIQIDVAGFPNSNFCPVNELDLSYCSNNTINGNGTKNLSLSAYYLEKIIFDNSQYLEKIILYAALKDLKANNCPLLNEINTKMIGLGATSTPLEASNCPNLKKISMIFKYQSFDGTSFSNLENLVFYSEDAYDSVSGFYQPNEELQSLLLNNNTNLKTLEIYDYTLKNLSLNGLPQLQSINSYMGFGELLQNISYMSTECMQTLNIQNCPLLTNITIAGQHGLKTTTIKNCSTLPSFEIPLNSYSGYYFRKSLESLEIENCTLLNKIKIPLNKLTNLKILNCPALEQLDVENNLLSTFDLTGSMASIKKLNLLRNNLTNFNIQLFPNVETLELGGNIITDLDMSMHTKINTFKYLNSGLNYGGSITHNPPTYLKTVNLNGCPNIQTVNLESSVLDKVFLKI